MCSSALLELQEISYQVDGQRILDHISWRVAAGEHWALLGRNGSGKTTLLRVACGYLWPNAGGRVLRLGQELTDLQQLRRGIGWVTAALAAQVPPRERAVDTVVSGRYACLGLHRLMHQRPTARDYEDAAVWMRQLGVEHLSGRFFGVLSQGEQQKTLLARACMPQPLLMILDEPCAGLDPASREVFLAAVQRLAESPNTPALVLVTHHVEEIMPAFSQTLMLDSGRVACCGPTRRLLDESLLKALYDGYVTRVMWSRDRAWPVG